MYEGGQQQRDPADETFDRLITMLIQSEQSDNGTHAAAATWRFLHYVSILTRRDGRVQH